MPQDEDRAARLLRRHLLEVRQQVVQIQVVAPDIGARAGAATVPAQIEGVDGIALAVQIGGHMGIAPAVLGHTVHQQDRGPRSGNRPLPRE